MSSEDMKVVMNAMAATGGDNAVYQPPLLEKKSRRNKGVSKPQGHGRQDGGDKEAVIGAPVLREESPKVGEIESVAGATADGSGEKTPLNIGDAANAQVVIVNETGASDKKRPEVPGGGGALTDPKKAKVNGPSGVETVSTPVGGDPLGVNLFGVPAHFKPSIEVQTSDSSLSPYRLPLSPPWIPSLSFPSKLPNKT